MPADDPSVRDSPRCDHGRPILSDLTCAQKGHFGCDNAPSSMTGHAGRCGSLDDHAALLRQGFGIGPSTGGASTTPDDHGRPEIRRS